MDHFALHSEYQPTGDQPAAIAELVKGFREGKNPGRRRFWESRGRVRPLTMANVIQQLNKPDADHRPQ